MKKRKRITLIFSVIACLAFTLGLSACDKENSSEPTHTHSFTSYVSDNNATCEKDCTETAVCDFEGCQATDTRTIPNTKLTPTEGIVYKLLESGDGYEVTGYTGTDTQVYIPAIYENLPVTTIGEEAFYACVNLTEIVIPNSVTTIGFGAFAYCDSLTEIVIPDSVTTIGFGAFAACNALTEIKVGENNTAYQSIEGNLYTKGGKTLLQYSIGKTVTSFTIPDSVTTIGEGAFYNCSSLTEIVIPNSVTTIGEGAFYNCSNLTEVVIPDSVTTIGKGAFGGCTNLTEIVIPNSVTTIGGSAFDSCSSLTEIVIPNSVTTIGFYAFYGCSSLTIYCEAESKPDGWDTNWIPYVCPVVWNCNSNDVANDGYIYTVIEGIRYGIKAGDATVVEQSRSIKTVTILSAITYKGTSYPVTMIGELAFEGCDSLTEIVIPNSVTTIGFGAFFDCGSLTEIVIGDNVTTISYRAFVGCDSLTEIVIPDSVTTIGVSAFYYCSSLTEIVIPNSVTTIGYRAFEDCDNLTIYCEAESKPDGWDSDWNATNCPVVWGYTGE